MLILTRRIGESIIIGTDKERIKVTLLASKGGQSKIGIKAPNKVFVHREEIYKRILKEQQKGKEGQS